MKQTVTFAALAVLALTMLAGCEANGRSSLFSKFDPFCRPGTPHREVATIEIDGERLKDEVILLKGATADDGLHQ